MCKIVCDFIGNYSLANCQGCNLWDRGMVKTSRPRLCWKGQAWLRNVRDEDSKLEILLVSPILRNVINTYELYLRLISRVFAPFMVFHCVKSRQTMNKLDYGNFTELWRIQSLESADSSPRPATLGTETRKNGSQDKLARFHHRN